MKAVIVAAGMGTRMMKEKPKTLTPFGEETILSTIMKNISLAGIREFVLVTGYEGELIKEYLETLALRMNYAVAFAENREWTRGNGISVLAAEPFVDNAPFILSMSDHIVSPKAIERTAKGPGAANLLLVDPRIGEVFDIDDATKVRTEGNRIVEIGKEIEDYNGIDCGIFRLTPRYFGAMRKGLENRKESISAAITGLIGNNDMEAVFMENDEYWCDIDTPQAYADALKRIAGRE